MVTNQAVKYGEEVCWDYQCQTDSREVVPVRCCSPRNPTHVEPLLFRANEMASYDVQTIPARPWLEEMEGAICYCGSKGCRVSYLHYNGESDLSSHLRVRGTPAHATAALLRACGPHSSLDPSAPAAAAAATAAGARGKATQSSLEVSTAGGRRTSRGSSGSRSGTATSKEVDALFFGKTSGGGNAAEVAAAEVAGEAGPEEDERAVLAGMAAAGLTLGDEVGRCRFTVSKPVLTAPMISALETIIS
jgi:hypothetical protein